MERYYFCPFLRSNYQHCNTEEKDKTRILLGCLIDIVIPPLFFCSLLLSEYGTVPYKVCDKSPFGNGTVLPTYVLYIKFINESK